MKLPRNIPQSVEIALEEDIGAGDVTADLIPLDEISKATVVCREPTVLVGTAWFDEAFRQIDNTVIVQWYFKDGDFIAKESVLCKIQGASRSLLSGERVALNFLQLLSGTAMATRAYVKAIEGMKAQILDTRKTLPGLRQAQKYAVSCGGGKNHRMGLYEHVLIKENHIMAAGSIARAVAQARVLHPDLTVEIEAENLAEFGEACKASPDVIMLDNFTLDDMKLAIQRNVAGIKLEASGGVNLDSVRAIAKTGVDYVSVGEITKNVTAIDLSMRFGERI